MNKTITLYGHLIVDKIIVDFKEKISLGGIANVWHGIKFLTQNIIVNISPTDIGEAIILVDKKSNQRVGRGCLSLSSTNIIHKDSDWHHIAYINQITHSNFIQNIDRGVISADITKESPEKVLPLLKYIDYLFISEDDLFMDLKELGKLTKGWVISHSPIKSVYTDGKKTIEYNIPENLLLNDINVLGAGDYFASGFINGIIEGNSISETIVHAHKNTTKILEKQI
tara:strand:+ start:1984 stop:2661 length:678 start_codon:yes stop_codon:yes gene_type:complete